MSAVATRIPEPSEALGATDVIEADDPRVLELADRVAGDAQGTDAARRLFEWVRDEIRYEMAPQIASREDWRATGTLDRGYGFCQQKAVLLAALLRARGIPAGILVQDLIDYKIPPHYVAFLGSQHLEVHGLTIACLDGRWLRVDATLPRSLVEKKGYRLVELTGEGDAVLPETDLAGERHFEVASELGAWADMPQEVVEQTLGLAYLHTPEYKKMARRHGPDV